MKCDLCRAVFVVMPTFPRFSKSFFCPCCGKRCEAQHEMIEFTEENVTEMIHKLLQETVDELDLRLHDTNPDLVCSGGVHYAPCALAEKK